MTIPAVKMDESNATSDDHASSSAIYMLRTTQQHHVQLSAMADQKANILIGASLVVITMLLGQLHTSGFSLPMVVMGIFIFSAALCALLAVTPSLKRPLKSTNNNWLFFGAFSHLSQEEYTAKMLEMLKTDQSVYEAMIQDIYQMGMVLHKKKYRYLSYSYRLFIVGLITTFFFTVATMYLK